MIRDIILKLFPKLEPADVKSTSSGANGEDLQLSPAARRLLPLSFEAKFIKAFAGYKFYEQATANCPIGAEPIAVVKANQKKPLALVDLEYFLGLFKDK